jgi:hypothetical protein
MIPVEFEPTIPANKQLHTRALDYAATGIAHYGICFEENKQSNTVEPWIASNLVCECFTRRAKILKEFYL